MGKTSSEVKDRYNAKVYAQVSVKLKKDLVARWETQIALEGIGKAEFIRRAIQEYLGESAD